MITALLMDSQDFSRIGLLKILNDAQGIKVIANTSSYDDAFVFTRQHNPAVVLLDIHKPDLIGLDTLRKMIRMNHELKVIVVTEQDDSILTMAFQAGALGLLTRRASADEAIRAVRTVFAGQRYLSAEMAQRLAFHRFDQPQGSPFELLSEREKQVVCMILNGDSAQNIAHKLCLSPKTINGCRYRIHKKLHITSDIQLVKLAIKHGLLKVE